MGKLLLTKTPEFIKLPKSDPTYTVTFKVPEDIANLIMHNFHFGARAVYEEVAQDKFVQEYTTKLKTFNVVEQKREEI